MSTLSEHTGNGTPAETRFHREDAKEQIDSLLKQFDVLPSRFDRFIFRYIYIYLICLLLPGVLLAISPVNSQLISQPQAGTFLLGLGVATLPIIVIISILWRFDVWRRRASKTLCDLLGKRSIYHPDGDANKPYLRFLEHYHDALGSPKRYFFSGFLMITNVGLIIYGTVVIHSVVHLDIFAAILFVVGAQLVGLSYLGGAYCIGILTWVLCISGWYVRKMMRAFELRIQPFHTDKCGGLKLLGNFCFGLVTPLLIGSGLTIGYTFFFFLSVSISGIRLDSGFLVIVAGSFLLLLLLYGVPVFVVAFMLPIRDIHFKMVSEGETDEATYNADIEAMREKIQSLLDNDKVEEAKVVQEKKALLETLHVPYPTWPFSFRSKIYSTLLGASGSLLVGMITAAIPVFFSLLFHTRQP
jgi:hypothetical protein